MIYHLFSAFRDFVTQSLGFYAWEEVMFRCIMAALTGLFIAWFTGPKIIRWLMKKKIGDRPEFHHETLNQLNREKTNTPTI